jgi:hypothetical protein
MFSTDPVIIIIIIVIVVIVDIIIIGIIVIINVVTAGRMFKLDTFSLLLDMGNGGTKIPNTIWRKFDDSSGSLERSPLKSLSAL